MITGSFIFITFGSFSIFIKTWVTPATDISLSLTHHSDRCGNELNQLWLVDVALSQQVLAQQLHVRHPTPTALGYYKINIRFIENRLTKLPASSIQTLRHASTLASIKLLLNLQISFALIYN